MPAPTQTDLERLLAPISPDAPAGVSLRQQGTYDRIREARREDDASLPQGAWARPLKVADWGTVVSLAAEALERRSKDLQIAAWLVDAWALLHGIVGATRGLELVAGLLDRFWDGLFPELEDGDDELRARLLEWIDDALSRRLRAAKLGDDRVAIAFGDWERAAPGAPEGAASPTREGLLARMSMVGAAEWSRRLADVDAALAAAAAVDGVIAVRMKSPPPRRAEDTLRAMRAMVTEILEAAGVTAPKEGSTSMSTPDHDGAGATGGPGGGGPGAPSGGPIGSRAEAYQRLEEAADYLLRTEPHSPVPYLVKRAISWGNMPLATLLQEFISGADDLVTAHRLLGMRPREE
jgi:type VI secretion system protein ImpA